MTDTPPPQPRLGDRFEKALAYTFQAHRQQTRKGTDTPYMGHLLGVASLVIEDGGDEDQVIAALLHDAVEDQGGQPRLADIRAHFGPAVAAIVEACSDSAVVGEKAPWRERKEKYLKHLASAPPEVLRVSAADKLYNARAILADYRALGEGLWSRFSAPREDILWYYESLVRIFRQRGPAGLARDLESALRTLHYLVKRYDTRYQAALADLRGVMAPFKRELDDPSAEFLARLRGCGGLRDADWQHVLGEIPSALEFLAGPNPTLTQDERGQSILDLDADPRNADWLRLAAAARRARHHLPFLAAMWLWQVGHERGASFWDVVARIAEQMQFPRHELAPPS
jgi:HD domain